PVAEEVGTFPACQACRAAGRTTSLSTNRLWLSQIAASDREPCSRVSVSRTGKHVPLTVWRSYHGRFSIVDAAAGPKYTARTALVSVLRLYAPRSGCARSHHECRATRFHLRARRPSQRPLPGGPAGGPGGSGLVGGLRLGHGGDHGSIAGTG